MAGNDEVERLRAEVVRLTDELEAERERYDNLAKATRLGASMQVRALRAGDARRPAWVESSEAGAPASIVRFLRGWISSN